VYLWWLMYAYIREWPLEQPEGSLGAIAATAYAWLLLAYLAWRVACTFRRSAVYCVCVCVCVA
jgi:hypothetical protein